MIKIEKDLNDIPSTLNSAKTDQRRKELIEYGRYINNSIYDSRYKLKDIKEKLRSIYKNKCAFCEQRIEQFAVEHFRPKNIYYWLAYSWDNLLLACPTCNGHKNKHFETLNERAILTEEELEQIHQLTDKYNGIESSKLIHPEKEAIDSLLIFGKDGSVRSDDERVDYTINICRLNRNDLKDERKKIIDDLERKLTSRLYEVQSGDEDARIKIKGLIEDFIKDSKNIEKTYIAFRRYAVEHFLPKK